MKKLSLLFLIVLMVSCRCLPQRIPLQTIYAGPDCEASLPNYLEWISARDNCEGVILTQFPLPGFILSAGNLYTEVIITAKDISGNIDLERFDVILLDTILPELIIDSALLGYTWDQRFELLDAFQASLDTFITDSLRTTHNLVMTSTPTGKHFGAWYERTKYMVPTDEASLGGLRNSTMIDCGSPADDWFTMDEGGAWTNDTITFIDYPFGAYNSERYGNFNYRIPIGSGIFIVDLYFAEIFWDEAGERVFDVEIEDKKVLDNFDIMAATEGRRHGYTTGWTIDIHDGWLDINFISLVDYAKVSAIRIEKVYQDILVSGAVNLHTELLQ